MPELPEVETVRHQLEARLTGAVLAAYGRAGEPCQRCGEAIIRPTVAGRGTHWCPRCQR